MKIFKRLVVLAVFIGIGFWAWSYFFPNPQKIIRNRLNKSVSLISFTANEGNISRVAAIQSLGSYFTDEVEIKIDVPGNESHTFNRREELTQAAMAARSAVSSLKAEFADINIDLGADTVSATAAVTLQVDINGEKNAVIQELKIYLKKVKGDWLIHRVDTVRTLR